MIEGRRTLAAVAAVALLHGVAWADVQSSDQQKCINKMNKDGIKVQAAQGKENVECVKRKSNNELPGAMDAEECLTEDLRLKVQGKQDKTIQDETSFCTGPGLPDFGYTTGAYVGTTAAEVEVELIHDVFGDEPIDGGLFEKDPNVNEAVCQRNTVDRIEKLMQSMGREFVKCKKNALKVGKDPFPLGATAGVDLEDCVDNSSALNSVAADTKGKLAKRKQNLLDTLNEQCEATSVSAVSFPGQCNGQTGAGLHQCLIDLVECRFCQFVNFIDAINVDCDAFSFSTCDF